MEQNLIASLAAEKGASLSSGSLRLYAFNQLNTAVGCLDLYCYDPLNRRAAVGIMVASEHRRKGYALAMLEKLEEFFSDRGAEDSVPPKGKKPNTERSTLHTLYADIAATNSGSLALFRKAGYTQCGHFKEWLNVNNHYVDTVRMQKTL